MSEEKRKERNVGFIDLEHDRMCREQLWRVFYDFYDFRGVKSLSEGRRTCLRWERGIGTLFLDEGNVI